MLLMIAERVTDISHSLPIIDGITKKSFQSYKTWQDSSKGIEKRILAKFKEAACASLPFNDMNRPEEQRTDPVKIEGSELEFKVKTTPATKKPSHMKVISNFETYIQYIAQEKERTKIKGILTIDNELYIQNSLILNKLDGWLASSLEGKEGITQELELDRPVELRNEIPEKIIVMPGWNYAAVTDYNGRAWALAKNFKKEGDNRANKFKKLVLVDSLKTLDKDSESFKKEGKIETLQYTFDDIIFLHQLEPRSQLQYNNMILLFNKEIPNQPRTNSKIGDLVKIEAMRDAELARKLKEKGLINDEFIGIYKPRERNNEMYVRLTGIGERLKYAKENLITKTIEQNISLSFKV